MSVRTPRTLFLLGLALTTTNAAAQPSDADVAPSASSQCDLTTLEAAPSLSITAQQGVGAAIRQANACLGQSDAACAEAALTSVQALTLSDDERAVLALPHADLATLRRDGAAAERVYREALALPAISDSLRRGIAWRLALLLNTRGEFAEALRGLDSSFDCDSWTAEALASRAISYRNLGARAFGLENFEAATRLFELEGRAMPAAFEKIYQDLVAMEAPKQIEGADVVPLFRASPSYPQRAIQRGAEGWVQLEFEISDLGTTENVRVVESSEQVFDAAAIAAVQRWRYVPRFENGLPVARGTTRTVMSFCLDTCSFRRNPPPKLTPAGTSPTP